MNKTLLKTSLIFDLLTTSTSSMAGTRQTYWQWFIHYSEVLYMLIIVFLSVIVLLQIKNGKELRRIENELKQAKNFASATLDALSAHLCVLDKTGKIIAVNQAWKTFCNTQSANYFLGNNYLSICENSGKDDVAQASSMAQGIRSVMNGEQSEFILEYPCKINNESLWFSARVTSFLDNSGNIVIAHVNITESKHAEEALLQSEQNYRELVENTGALMLRFSLDGTVTYFNHHAEQFFGYQAEEILGQNILGTIVPEQDSHTGQNLSALINNILLSPEKYEVNENENMTRDGQRVFIHWSNRVLFDKQGAASGILSIGRDITQRRLIEQQLKASEARFRAIIEASSIPYALNDDHGNITFLNNAFIKTFGYTLKDIPTLSDWWPKAYPDNAYREQVASNWQHRIDLAKQNATNFEPMQAVICCKNGSTRTALIGAVSLENTFRGLHLVELYDITEREKMEASLRINEHRLRGLYELSPIGIALVDLAGNFIQVNRAFKEITGYGDIDLDNTNYWQMNAKIQQIGNCQINALLDNHHYGPVEEDYLNKEGRLIPTRLRSMLITDENGSSYIWSMIEDISQNRQAEMELRKLAQAVEQSPVSIVITDISGSIEYVNPAFTHTTGYSAQEAIGQNSRILKSGKTSLQEYQAMWKQLTTGHKVIQIFHNRRKDGSLYWERAYIAPVFDIKNNITHYLAVKENITKEKESEDALRAASRYARTLIEVNLDPMVTIAPNGKITDINQAMITLTGRNREALIGADFSDCFMDPNCAQTGYRQAFENGYVTDYPLSVRRQDGSVAHVLYNASIFHDESNHIQGILATARDITERKVMEDLQRTLHEGTEAKYAIAEIFQHSDVPLATRFAEALQIVFSMRGLSVQKKGGVFLYDQQTDNLSLFQTCGEFSAGFIHTEQELLLRRCISERAIHSGKIIISDNCFDDYRHENQCPNLEAHGHYIVPLMMAAKCLGVLILYTEVTPDSNPARLDILEQIGSLFTLAIANDQAQQTIVAAKEAAELTAQSKALFLANMSHEIRTPMNAIIGLTQLALNKDTTPEIEDYLYKIRSSSKTLLDLLNDILDFSKLESGNLALDNEPFNLDDILDNLRSLFTHRAEEKHIRLLIPITSDLPKNLIGDALRLQQILINLIANAIKFTEHGTVSLAISLQQFQHNQARLLFSVIDTGIGMSAKDLEKLFQPFTQVDGSITRRFGGTGLGLTISRNLLQLMGGEFSVTSTPGKGSVFSFEITLDVISLPMPQPIQSGRKLDETIAQYRQSLTNARILVAEDNQINQQVVREFLELAGIKVTVVNHGRLAVEQLQLQQYDVVLMDVHMPEMDGFEATKRIRTQVCFDQLPILALTAGVTQEERKKCLESGMNDFIAKPIDPLQLLKTLNQWIALRPQAIDMIDQHESAPEPSCMVAPKLNIQNLLTLLGNNQALAMKILLDFEQDMGDAANQIATLIGARDFSAASKLAHQVKGAAGNIGAEALAIAAENIEAELKQQLASASSINQFRAELYAAITSIHRLRDGDPSTTST